MTVEEAAKELGRSENWVRIMLQQKRVDFGIAVYNERTDTWSYDISRAGLWQYRYGYVPEILQKVI